MDPEPKVIDVARDFTPTPGGRYRKEGEWSGEQFRVDLVEPALKDSGEVIIDLDGPEGFTTSFLEEVFGGLVRKYGANVMRRVHVQAIKRPFRTRKVQELVDQAIEELAK
jgi:hypothetical protein